MCSVQPNPKNKIKHIVAVLSGKGGVGKSTITVLLARALSKKGYKVGIMDADITGPSIPRLMDAQNEQAYATRENEVIPVDVDGIKIVSLNYMLENENDPVIWRGPIVGNVVKQFYTDVLWEDLDYLLIDMPPGTGDVALTILQELPVEAVLMVSTPQPMVSMIVTKAIKMCNEMHIRVLGVIENMAYLECPNCHEQIKFYDQEELDQFEQESHTKIYAKFPMLDLIRNVHQYETYDLKNQEHTLSIMNEVADEIISDLS